MSDNRMWLRNTRTGEQVMLANYLPSTGWIAKADAEKLRHVIEDHDLPLHQRKDPQHGDNDWRVVYEHGEPNEGETVQEPLTGIWRATEKTDAKPPPATPCWLCWEPLSATKMGYHCFEHPVCQSCYLRAESEWRRKPCAFTAGQFKREPERKETASVSRDIAEWAGFFGSMYGMTHANLVHDLAAFNKQREDRITDLESRLAAKETELDKWRLLHQAAQHELDEVKDRLAASDLHAQEVEGRLNAECDETAKWKKVASDTDMRCIKLNTRNSHLECVLLEIRNRADKTAKERVT